MSEGLLNEAGMFCERSVIIDKMIENVKNQFFFRILADSFEMLKALYDFTAVYPKTISFDEGEYFILHQTSARQRNWWQVVSMKGNIGFVPSNYVMKLKVRCY